MAESEKSRQHWEAILARLTATPRCRAGLERRLRDRGCPAETAQELLDRFEEIGLIDDKAYGLLFVDSHQDWGPLRLKGELRARGLAPEVIQQVLEEGEIGEWQRGALLVQRWQAQGLSEEKILGRLLRRGFSAGLCRDLLEMGWEKDFFDGK